MKYTRRNHKSCSTHWLAYCVVHPAVFCQRINSERAALATSSFLDRHTNMSGGEGKIEDEFVLDSDENKTSDRAPSHLDVPTAFITGPSRSWAYAEGGTAVSRRAHSEKDNAHRQAKRVSSWAHVATHDVNEHRKDGKKPWDRRVISGVLLWVLFVTLVVGCLMVYVKGTFASVYGIFYLTGTWRPRCEMSPSNINWST